MRASEQSDTERTIESIRSSANSLLSTFRSKLDSLRGNEDITSHFLRQGFDGSKCFEEAIKFFGSDEVRYLAVDGTKFEEDRLDMLVFFAGAFGYGGNLHFDETKTTFEPPKSVDDSSSLSSAIPVSEEYSMIVAGEKTEGGFEVDSDRVTSSLMHLAEYYLAYNSVISDERIKVVLVDRTISGDIAHISWKMREPIEQGRCVLTGFETSQGSITKSDLELGRMLVKNDELKIPAPRSQLLKFAVMNLLIEDGSLNEREIGERIGANPNRVPKIAAQIEKDFVDVVQITQNGNEEKISVSSSLKTFWERLLEGVLSVSDHVFHSPSGEHPLQLRKPGSLPRWITADDIDYLTLIMITALLKESWKRNILLLGIVKDSASNELVKTVIPILEDAGLVGLPLRIPAFESDKMLLQANSLVNSEGLSAPWRTFEYDVCFRTISPMPREKSPAKKGEWNVGGAFKNVIASERMFVKAYFQLWKSEEDPTVRSHVFIYDRPCYPQYDLPREGQKPELVLRHVDNKIEEEIIPAMHFLKDSPISDLVMGILYSMGTEAIPEALGHNYPLFLADKRAKVAETEAKRMCSAAVELEMAKARLDQQVLYERRYRDYRSSVESDRRSRKGK